MNRNTFQYKQKEQKAPRNESVVVIISISYKGIWLKIFKLQNINLYSPHSSLQSVKQKQIMA